MKIRIRKQVRNNRGSQIREREKWVHLDRCKVYSGKSPVVVNSPLRTEQINNENDDEGDQPDGLILNGENQDPGAQSGQNLGLDSGNGFSDGEEATTNTSEEEVPSVERRYPLRNRKAKQFDDFISWDMIPKGGERVPTGTVKRNQHRDGRY